MWPASKTEAVPSPRREERGRAERAERAERAGKKPLLCHALPGCITLRHPNDICLIRGRPLNAAGAAERSLKPIIGGKLNRDIRSDWPPVSPIKCSATPRRLTRV